MRVYLESVLMLSMSNGFVLVSPKSLDLFEGQEMRALHLLLLLHDCTPPRHSQKVIYQINHVRVEETQKKFFTSSTPPTKQRPRQ